jgi:hypothetical protein
MWETDFSKLKTSRKIKSNENIDTVSHYLKTHPEVVFECFHLVKLIDANTMYEPS